MERLRVFISYAHRDCGNLAKRLQADLQAVGFDAWLDMHRLLGGDVWTREIETAIDDCDVALAILSTGSFQSDICRAEQERSLAKNKLVIPVRGQAYCDVPLHLQTRQYIDFSDDTKYAVSLQQLEKSIQERRGVVELETEHHRYNNAPPLPDKFVDRPEILAALRNALFQDAPNRNIAVTALQGMGGIGKTVLAEALCHDEVVRHAYPDGIFWFSIGKESRVTFDLRIEAVPGLRQLLGAYSGEQACINQYRHTFRDKSALIVLDDVWHPADIEPFRAESARSRLLLTTRDTDIAATFGAREFIALLPTNSEAREVLASWTAIAVGALPPQANAIIAECQNLPLALAMIGAQLRGKPVANWDIVLGLLRRAALAKIKARFPEPHTSLFRAIHVSFEALQAEDSIAAQRYLALAVMLEDMPVVPTVQQTLWNVDETEALETADRFIGLSLAQPEASGGGVRLHDLQLYYVRSQYHDEMALSLIRGAVRLSEGVVNKEPNQFTSQLIGRLLQYRDIPSIRDFMSTLVGGTPGWWLQPLHPALYPPGTSLIRTLEGHRRSGVALSGDGRIAVSASYDGTLDVWDVERGRPVRAFKGHAARVRDVAMSKDGRIAISASDDGTLKVWDLESGRPIWTLEGHSAAVKCVAMTRDGLIAISGSEDGTLKVWGLESGRPLRTLKGHPAATNRVALSNDGSFAISAANGVVKMWDVDAAVEVCTIHRDYYSGNAVAISPDGLFAVSASDPAFDYRYLEGLPTVSAADYRYGISVWDVKSTGELRALRGHYNWVNAVAVSGDGRIAISASQDKLLKVWNLESGHELRTLPGHSEAVEQVAISEDGRIAVSASLDGTVKVWNVRGGRDLQALSGHWAGVNAVDVSTTRFAVSASDDETLKVWDVESGEELRVLEGHSAAVYHVSISADATIVASASANNVLKIWELNSGHELRTREGPVIQGMAMSRDGRLVVSCGKQTLKILDVRSGHEERTLYGHSADIWDVAITGDGRRAISASADTTLKLWDVENGYELRELRGHSDVVTKVALSENGLLAVSASLDKTVRVWDLERGREVRSLEGGSGSLRTRRAGGLAISQDGLRVAYASSDKGLEVWDLKTGTLLATFTCDATTLCCAFINPGNLMAGDALGRVHFLRLEEPKGKG